jgi:serine/threonine protein kinase
MDLRDITRRINKIFKLPASKVDIILCEGCGYPIPRTNEICSYCGSQTSKFGPRNELSDSPWGIHKGKTILRNKYEWVRPINVGGMGRVDLALDKSSNSFLVLKSPLLTGAADDAVRRSKLEFEAAMLKNINHPNIVHYIDSFEENGVFFLALQYIPGLPLSILRKKTVPEEGRLTFWTCGLLDAIDYLHNIGIVYRDLKPSNIMIGPNDQAILIDFGAAQYLTQNIQPWTSASIFTPMYAAPEMLLQNRSDVRSDVYSLGATLYYVSSSGDPPRPPVDGTINLPMTDALRLPNIENLIRNCCMWRPEWRPLSMKAAKELLSPNVRPVLGLFKPRLILLTMAGMATYTEWLIPEGETIIGRTLSSDDPVPSNNYIPINDSYVSKTPKVDGASIGHARIWLSANRSILEDFQSSNGTYVNGFRIFAPVELSDGDRISLGPYTILEYRVTE